VHGRGPYLFLVAPNSVSSAIDARLADELGLWVRPEWRSAIDQNDREVRFQVAEVLSLQIGDLSIRHTRMRTVPAGSLRFRGQPVAGVIGGDLLSSTITLDVDRDAGVVTLALTGHERPPAGAVAVEGRVYDGLLKIPVAVEGDALEMVVDPGARRSGIWPRVAARLELAFAGSEEVIDEYGSTADVSLGARAARLQLDGLRAVARFGAYWVRSFRETSHDGALGQDFLAAYRVLFDRDHARLWLAPRAEVPVASRLRRWPGCEDGCVTARLDAGRLTVTGRSDGAWEALLVPLDGAGRRLGRDAVRVTLAAGAPSLATDDQAVVSVLLGAASVGVFDAYPAQESAAGAVSLARL
jgi:hypothetical protein